MRILTVLVALTIALFAIAAAQQAPPPNPQLIINRMSSAYRSLQSYYDVVTVKRLINKKEVPATLTIATQKPSKFLLELKGDYLNTLILSDGENLVSLRPDRKAYTKAKAPMRIINGDFLGKTDMPSMGARIITSLLAATGREGDVGKLLSNAKVSGPQGFGNKLAYVFRFPYDISAEVEVFVTADDYLVKLVRVVRDGAVEWSEAHDKIEVDKDIPAGTFTRALPEGAHMVASLPELEKPPVEVAEDDTQKKSEADQGQEAKGEAGGKNDRGGAGQAGEKRPSAAEISRGRSAYRSAGCNRCHALGGQGGRVGPDLSTAGADPSHTVKWLADHIKNPQSHTPGSGMPSFGSRLGNSSIQAIAAYLASLK